MSADQNRVDMVVGALTYRMDSSAGAYKALLVSTVNSPLRAPPPRRAHPSF